MVHQYRVYAVMAPKVHLTDAADGQTDIELMVSALEPKLQAAMAKAANPANAVKAYNDLLARVVDATAATGKVDIPTVLKVAPPGYPADGAPLATAKSTPYDAQDDLKSARSDIRIIRTAIQPGKPAVGAPNA